MSYCYAIFVVKRVRLMVATCKNSQAHEVETEFSHYTETYQTALQGFGTICPKCKTVRPFDSHGKTDWHQRGWKSASSVLTAQFVWLVGGQGHRSSYVGLANDTLFPWGRTSLGAAPYSSATAKYHCKLNPSTRPSRYYRIAKCKIKFLKEIMMHSQLMALKLNKYFGEIFFILLTSKNHFKCLSFPDALFSYSVLCWVSVLVAI